MKKIIYTLFAFAAVTFVSCNKEESTPVNEQPQPEVELVPMTFTAGVDTKVTLGENNAINWEESDKISIFDGTDNREFTIVKGSITGNTATFTGEVAASAKDFVALYPYTKGASYTDGKITGVPLSKTGKFAPVATASASSDNNTLNFTTVIGFVKFKLADAEGVTSVTISGNNGELIGGSISIDTKNGNAIKSVARDITIKPTGGFDNSSVYYIPIAPQQLSKGLTISTLKNDIYSYKSSTKETIIKSNIAFNLGVLSEFNSTPNNYVKWLHGESFQIGNETFNQKTFGYASLLNSNSTIQNDGVYFIDSDVDVTYNIGSNNNKKLIVIGNNPAQRSTLKANSQLKIISDTPEEYAVFSNLNVDFSTLSSFPISLTSGTFGYLIFDNCKISPSTNNNTLHYNNTAGNAIEHFILKDSEIQVPSKYTDFKLIGAAQGNQNYSYITIDNSIIWSEKTSAIKFNIWQSNASTTSVLKKLTINQSTFINMQINNGFVYVTDIEEIDIHNNVFYTEDTSLNSWQYILRPTKNAPKTGVGKDNFAYIKDNSEQSFKLFYDSNHLTPINAEEFKKSPSLFDLNAEAVFDTTTGIFTPSKNYKQHGAQRNL